MRASGARPLPTAVAQHGAGECTRVFLPRVLQVASKSGEWERRCREGGGKRVGPASRRVRWTPSFSAVRECGAARGAGAGPATTLVVSAGEVGLWAAWFLRGLRSCVSGREARWPVRAYSDVSNCEERGLNIWKVTLAKCC